MNKSELKAPDHLQVILTRTLDWLLKNGRLLLTYVALPAVVVVAGVYGWQKFRESQRLSRLEELGKIHVVYDDENRKAADKRQEFQKQIDELDQKIAAATAKPAEGAATPAPTLDPKWAADKAGLEKQRDAIRPEHPESEKLYAEFYKKYDGTPEGWVAGLTSARLMVEREAHADARQLLDGVLQKSAGASFHQTQARFLLVGLLEETGDFDKALAELETLEKGVEADLKPRVLLARGRIQMLKNAREDAKKTFSSLIEAHGASTEAQKARSLQALLN